jgi:hypothetical protein
MAFDKRYPNRKDWRRPYFGPRQVDRTCRAHGSCPWCKDGRLHRDKKQSRAAADDVVGVPADS